MNIVVFEDGSHDNFYPLSLTRPLWDLRWGMYAFRERLELFFNKHLPGVTAEIYYFTRNNVAPYYRERYPDLKINDYSVFSTKGEILFINSLAYPAGDCISLEVNTAVMNGLIPLWALIRGPLACDEESSITGIISRCAEHVKEFTGSESADLVTGKKDYIWDLVASNGKCIIMDQELVGGSNKNNENVVTIIGDSGQVTIGNDTIIEPNVVINATDGPVIIGERTHIHAFTRIEGPAVIGPDCIVLGGKIREGTTIGPFCRIGGEIEESIIQGYSNKYHDGFIGHSYIGEWVNLGAMTSNSDLKNNYTNVKVYVPGARKRTGLNKVGCFIGDFAKTSIGTLINTGSSIGPGAMLVHEGSLTPAHIPPFSWFINSAVSTRDWLDDFLSSCRAATGRRGVDFTENYSTLMSELFEKYAEKQTS